MIPKIFSCKERERNEIVARKENEVKKLGLIYPNYINTFVCSQGELNREGKHDEERKHISTAGVSWGL